MNHRFWMKDTNIREMFVNSGEELDKEIRKELFKTKEGRRLQKDYDKIFKKFLKIE